MNRRDMLKGLGLAPLFGVPSFLGGNYTEDSKNDDEDNIRYTRVYKGFDIRWSKFLNHADSEKITGYWTGWNEKENIGFYSCVGGYSGDYRLGAIFNTCVLADHKFLTIRSSKEDKEEEAKKAFEKLIEEINSYYCVGRII